MKFVRMFFIFLLIIFPLGQIGRVEVGGGVNLLLNDVVAFLTVACWLGIKTKTKSFPKNILTKPILVFAAVALFSLLLRIGSLSPPQLFVSSLYLLRWISYAGLYFVVSDFDTALRQKIQYWLLGSGMVLVAAGFVQYFLYPNIRNLYYAGWDDHLYRMVSTLLDPNFLGGILVLTFLLAASSLFSAITTKQHKYFFFFVMVTSFISLLLTYSRGSFLSFIVGVSVLLLFLRKKELLVLVVSMFAIGLILLPKDLASEGVELLRTASIKARAESVQRALVIFKDYPLFGVGFNAYRYAQEARGTPATNVWGDIHSAAGTDNSFLFVLATTGIIGFSTYLFLWITIIKNATGNSVLIASLVAIFVHALFVNSLFYPHIMEWLWILIGITGSSKVGRLL